MEADWPQLIIGFISGGSIGSVITYFVKRFVEKHPHTEAQQRDQRTVELTAKYVELLQKATAANITINLRLETLDVIHDDKFYRTQSALAVAQSNVLVLMYWLSLANEVIAKHQPEHRPILDNWKNLFMRSFEIGSRYLDTSDDGHMREVLHAYYNCEKNTTPENVQAFLLASNNWKAYWQGQADITPMEGIRPPQPS